MTPLLKFQNNKLIILLSFISILFVFVGFVFENKILIFLPFGILISLIFSIVPRFLYFILICTIPISVVYDFNGSLSTDFPFEFITIFLMSMVLLEIFTKKNQDLKTLVKSPLTLVHFLLFISAILSTITALNHTVAIKYTLAKMWYLSVLFIYSFIIFDKIEKLKKFFWCFYIPFIFTVILSFIKTVIGNFNFENTNLYSLPFYSNHVIYATTMSIFLPFVFYFRTWYAKGSLVRILLTWSIILILIAIYFSYTRSCYLALIGALIYIYFIKFKKTSYTFLFIIVITILSIRWISIDYQFLKLQPDFTKTIMHQDFKDHLLATFRGKDASSMERLNMWIGGVRMHQDYIWTGVGPNNFPSNYKPYTLYHFHTWVSDNPLKLSCHNYFLLMLTEQGIIGFFIFTISIFTILYQIDQLYFKAKNKMIQNLTLTLGASFIILLINLLFSDLIETAKNGFFFFFISAILIRVASWNKKEL
jgi:hypothetical protein